MSEYLKRLSMIQQDKDQEDAFITESSQVVIAGPGSGKTFLLTTKAAKLLLEGKIPYPQKIACVTFSRQLADALVKEFRDLGVYDPHRMYVGTIHAFCVAEIIMPAINLLTQDDIPYPFRIASKKEKREALFDALRKQGKSPPNSEQDINIKSIEFDLDKFRRRYFCPDTNDFLRQDLPETSSHRITQDLNWSQFAKDYHQHLMQNSPPSIDFVRIEMYALHILKTQKEIVKTLSAVYPWWFIDEYQDLSPLFLQIVKFLVQSKRISVFAIGDPNQCIYEDLQGSKPESIQELVETVKELTGNESITLRTNYRSCQKIIDISDLVLGKKNGYKSSNKQPVGYELLKGVNDNQIVENVKSIIENSPMEQTIGILLGSRKDTFKCIFDTLGNLYPDIQTDRDPDFEVNTELGEWLQKIAQWCSRELYFYELLPFWNSFCQICGENLETKRVELERELFLFLQNLCRKDILLIDWLKGIHENILTKSRLEEYKKVRPDEVEEFETLVNQVSTVPRLRQKTVDWFGRSNARILLTTFFSSKGLEFDTTIVIDLDGIKKSQSAPELHKRLAYVAISRSKSRLFLLTKQLDGEFSKKLRSISYND